MPGAKGKYGVRAIVAWKKSREAATAAADDTAELRRRVQLARIRSEEADAEAKELRNREKASQMLDRAEVRAAFAMLCSATRRRFEQIPAAIRPMLPPELRSTIAEEIRSQISLALIEMGDWHPDEPKK